MERQESLQFFYEIFDATLPRQGPGNTASTYKALNLLLPEDHPYRVPGGAPKLRILDIGCGNGAQTIQLARQLKGTIQALDNHRPYLAEVNHPRLKARASCCRLKPTLSKFQR